MKKLLYLLIFLTFYMSPGLHGQSFQFDPTDNYEGFAQLNIYSIHRVFMENLTGGVLELGWERLDVDFPEEWEVTLCDFGGCHVGIPESGFMLPVSDTTRGYLKITVSPINRVDTATVSFYVFDKKFPDDGDTVSFTIVSGIFTNVLASAEKTFVTYPNPVVDRLFIKSDETLDGTFFLMDQNGKEIELIDLSNNDFSYVDMGYLPGGLYIAGIRFNDGSLVKRKILKK